MRWADFASEIRAKTSLTQEEFAAQSGVPLGTLRAWEQNVVRPRLAVVYLIKFALKDNKELCQLLEKIG